MDRREFLIRGAGALLVLPFGTFLVQCSSSNGGTISSTSPTEPDNAPPDAPPRLEGANAVYTSSNTVGHSHTFSIPTSSIATPPDGGVSGSTSKTDLHDHTLVLTQQDLGAVNANQTIKKETSSNAGHTHVFTIVKVS